MKKGKYAIHYKSDGCVDWVGDLISITKDRIVIDCVDPVLLRCGKWLTTGDMKNVPSSECCLFASMVDAKNACDTANEYFA